MDKDAVREYVEQSDTVLDSSPQMDEANTKAVAEIAFIKELELRVTDEQYCNFAPTSACLRWNYVVAVKG
jgi:hypothetical protein